jgi:hypothetical protein
MKTKSLRQLARELGVSASYLSQIKNGKKQPSEDLLKKLDIEVLTNLVNTSHQNNVAFAVRKRYNSTRSAEVAQSVEQRTENPRVPSSNLGLGTIIKRETGFPLKSKIFAGVKRKWLSGRASPCQGEGREFESRLPLSFNLTSRSGGMGRRDSLKNCWGATPVSVRVRPSAPFPVAELCSGSTGDFGSLSPGSNPGSAASFPRSWSWELEKISASY